MDSNKIDEDFMGALLMRKLGMKSNMLIPVTFPLSFLATHICLLKYLQCTWSDLLSSSNLRHNLQNSYSSS